MQLEDIPQHAVSSLGAIIYCADIVTDELYHVNSTAEQLFTLEKKDWENKKYYDVFRPILTEGSPTNISLVKGQKYVWRAYIPFLNKYYKISVSLEELNGKPVRLGIAEDITESVQFAVNAEDKFKEQDIINTCLEILLTPADSATIIKSFLEMVCGYYQADRVHVVHVPSDEEHLENIYEFAEKKDIQAEKILQSLTKEQIISWFGQFDDVETINLYNSEELEESSELFLENRVTKFLCSPLHHNNTEFFGFIGVVNPTDHLDKTSLLRSIAKAYESFYIKHKLTHALHNLSYYDSITGLLNRNSFEIRHKELEKQHNKNLAVFYFDINGLKYMNDTKGHDAGDELIRQSASILKNFFKDNAYRTGGDEFIVFVENILENDFKTLTENLKEAIVQNDKVSLSLGYLWNDGSMPLAQHLQKAEAMMYEDKRKYYEANNTTCRRRN